MSASVSSNGHIPMDYHIHTNISCDSEATMEQMCQSALSKGIHEIAFTEHYDVHPKDSCANYYKPAAYFAKLDRARREYEPQGLTIRAGVELGETHRWREQHQAVLAAYPYDYVLGSMHWVGDESVFDEGFYRKSSPDEVIPAYFRELLEMTRQGGFDVLAHADVIKRVAHRVYDHFEIAEWEDAVRPVWQACIDQGIGIEINASGLRLSVAEVHPGLEALRWYREMGGELLTLGSDGHRPIQVGVGLDMALTVAREAGFTRVCTYEKRHVARWITI
jgi:histidinol-phosphatase (PHP family)